MGTKRTPEGSDHTEALSVAERLALLTLLPEKGSIITMRVISELRQELAFTEKEMQSWELKQLPNGEVKWSKEKATNKRVEMGNVARDIIKAELRKRDESQTLRETDVAIWDRFVEGEPAKD
jgi:hypothetical protein